MKPRPESVLPSIDIEAELAKAGANTQGRWGELRFLARRYLLGTIGLVIMIVFVLAALLAPWIATFDPLAVNARHALAPPNAVHWLGADSFGRDDLLVRLGRRCDTHLASAHKPNVEAWDHPD